MRMIHRGVKPPDPPPPWWAQTLWRCPACATKLQFEPDDAIFVRARRWPVTAATFLCPVCRETRRFRPTDEHAR